MILEGRAVELSIYCVDLKIQLTQNVRAISIIWTWQYFSLEEQLHRFFFLFFFFFFTATFHVNQVILYEHDMTIVVFNFGVMTVGMELILDFLPNTAYRYTLCSQNAHKPSDYCNSL